MTLLTFCPACRAGDHAQHVAVMASPIPGLIGSGTMCRCEGECVERPRRSLPSVALLTTEETATMDQMERAARLAERAEKSIIDGAFGKAQAEALTSIALAMTYVVDVEVVDEDPAPPSAVASE